MTTFLDRVLAGEWGESPSEETLRAMWQAFWFDTAYAVCKGSHAALAAMTGLSRWETRWVEDNNPILPIVEAHRTARKVQKERDEAVKLLGVAIRDGEFCCFCGCHTCPYHGPCAERLRAEELCK